MFTFVLQKIKNKKWLNLCLLAGITLLSAVFACHPMLENGADDSLLLSSFTDYASENGEFPAVFARSGSCDTEEYPNAQSMFDRLGAYEDKWTEYVDLDTVASQQSLKLSRDGANSSLGRDNIYLSVGLLRGLSEHAEVVKGEGLDAQVDNAFPCLISESVMDDCSLVVGEELTFPYTVNEDGDPVRFRITGVVREMSYADNYWYTPLAGFEKQLFVSQETFDALLSDYNYETVQYEERLLLDYTEINGRNAERYLSYLEQFAEADKAFSSNLTALLENFVAQRKTIRTILWVLELPCIVLLLLFVYMVSNQVLTAEEGEIAALRSRGVRKGQIMALYLLESGLLSLVGLVLGVGLGFLMCKAAASTDGFLYFVKKDVSRYTFTPWMIAYAFLACVIAMLFMALPVVKRARMTIVEQKGMDRGMDQKPFWEKCFLDVILLAVSCYLLYNYNKQSGELSLSIIRGESLDPMVFLDSSLFLFACGLLFLRLSKYLVRLVYRIGKKRWSAPMYASFLQMIRSFKKQGFLAVFLIMTIASGIFNACMARTMNQNSEERIAYGIGTDARFTEKWRLHVFWEGEEMTWYYDEPDFARFDTLVESGLCESATRVIEDDTTDVSAGSKILTGCKLMGISTKEFGETAELLDGLNDSHWFNALNALAQEPDGVIISENMAEEMGLSVGDAVTYTRYSPLKEDQIMGTAEAKVCAVVECFPGYERYWYETDEKGETVERERYLIVGNYATIAGAFEMTPYNVWLRFADGVSAEEVKAAVLEQEDVELTSWSSMEELVAKSKSSALIQITNGLFTMTFLISILVCSAGFLIYWIMSIQSRELLFGVCRAMGMRMKQIRLMLVNEQIFGSLLPIAAGAGAGALGTVLFVGLLTIVYLPERHNIPIQLCVEGADFAKLFLAIAAVMAVCFVVLARLLGKMKIAQALKLGED